MALQVGIVGLPNAGKTSLFRALTGAETTGRDNVGMAAVPGTGAELLVNLRQVDLVLAVLDGWSGTRDARSDSEELTLELLAADRDHVQRRLERVTKQAKSGDAKLRAEVENLEQLAAHLEGLQAVSDLGSDVELPAELELLTIKPLMEIVNGPEGLDLKLEAELAELSDEEAAAFREGESALGAVVRRLVETLDLITFFTAGEKETRAWTLRNGESALDAAETIHSDIARGFIRAEVIRWDDLVGAGSHADARRQGLERVEGKTYVVQDGDVLNIRFNV